MSHIPEREFKSPFEDLLCNYAHFWSFTLCDNFRQCYNDHSTNLCRWVGTKFMNIHENHENHIYILDAPIWSIRTLYSRTLCTKSCQWFSWPFIIFNFEKSFFQEQNLNFKWWRCHSAENAKNSWKLIQHYEFYIKT